VTNPDAINGNTTASINADDDGGFFRWKAWAYYQTGPMTLSTTTLEAPTNLKATQ